MAFALLVDGVDGMVNRLDVLTKIRDVLDTPLSRVGDGAVPGFFNPETWGIGPEAKAGMDALMKLGG